MNDLGIALIWCAIQVSIVTTLAAALYFTFRRVGLAIGALAPLSALFIVVVLTVAAFLPVPSWIQLAQSTPSEMTVTNEPSSPVRTGEASLSATSSEIEAKDEPATGQTPLGYFTQAFIDELSTAQVTMEPQSRHWKWTGVVAIVFIAGAFFGMLHLLAGLIAMRRYRARSVAVTDAEMQQLLDVLRAQLSCRRTVELRKSEHISTAATVGWLRPMILLPPEWEQWSDQERRTVLAHELAHICRHDFLACVCGQISLAMHFYHPFVHWLVAQLRLEQELAADALAASVSGGRKNYLATLAEMALRQSDRRMGWAARAFLPTHNTFLKRIDMLRKYKLDDSTNRFANLSRVVLLALMTMIATAAMGLRGPEQPAFAQQPATEKQPERANQQRDGLGKQAGTQQPKIAAQRGIGLAYVPRDAAVVVALRPAALLARPKLKPLAEEFQQGDELQKQIGIAPHRIEQVKMIFLTRIGDRKELDLAGFVIRTLDADAAKAFATKFALEMAKHSYDGQEYFKSTKASRLYFMPDDRTIVASNQEEYLRRLIVAGKTGASKATWAQIWKQVSESDAAVQYNFTRCRAAIAEAVARGRSPSQFHIAAFQPVWDKADSLAIGAKLENELMVHAIANCKSVADAKSIKETVTSARTLVRNMLSAMREAASKDARPDGAMMLKLADIADGLLDKAKVSIREMDVVAETSADSEESVRFVAAMVPAVSSAREAARRTQSANNLKQIALAFHNYASVSNKFPSSRNGDGKHKHSWRVAILPYIEQQALYDQYRFDEPWDSEHNKKLIKKMPAIYRHPKAANGSTEPSYYVLTGADTIFDTKTRLSDISDGTTNTILIVEAKRTIPWTKPEDIPYDGEKPVPELGGFLDQGFTAACADGSVHFISKGIDEKLLRGLFTADGGEVTHYPQGH